VEPKNLKELPRYLTLFPQKFINILLFSCGFVLHFATANIGFDSHHIGHKVRPAIDISYGKTLYVDSFSWYQPLPHYLDAIVLYLSDYLIISLVYFYAFITFLTGIVLFFIMKNLFGLNQGRWAVVIFYVSSPEIGINLSKYFFESDIVYYSPLPWQGVIARFLIATSLLLLISRFISKSKLALLSLIIGFTISSVFVTGVALLIGTLFHLKFKIKDGFKLMAVIIGSLGIASTFYYPTFIISGFKPIFENQISGPSSWAVLPQENFALYLFSWFFTIGLEPFLITILLVMLLVTNSFSLNNTHLKVILLLFLLIIMAAGIDKLELFLRPTSLITFFSILFILFIGTRIKSHSVIIVLSYLLISIILVSSINSKSIWNNFIVIFSIFPLAVFLTDSFIVKFSDEVTKYFTLIPFMLLICIRFFPVFEERNIYYSGIISALFGFMYYMKLMTINSNQKLLFGQLLLIPLIFSFGSFLMKVNLNTFEIFNNGALKGFREVYGMNNDYIKNLRLIKSNSLNQPIIFFGHNIGDQLVAGDLRTPISFYPVPMNLGFQQDKFENFIENENPILIFNGYPGDIDVARQWIEQLAYCPVPIIPFPDNQPFYYLLAKPCGSKPNLNWLENLMEAPPWAKNNY